MNIQRLPIRESTVMLIGRIVFLMILCDVVYLIIRITVLDLNKNWVPTRDITFVFLIFLSSLYIIQSIIVAVLIEIWSHKYCLIDNGLIIEARGFITRKERAYELKNVKSVTFQHGLLGRIFHYGSVHITITSPNIKEELELANVSQAKEIAEYIKKFL